MSDVTKPDHVATSRPADLVPSSDSYPTNENAASSPQASKEGATGDHEATVLRSSIAPTTTEEEEWPLKTISWPPLPPTPSALDGGTQVGEGLTVRVITQNHNGPCSLIALCNVLILRGDVHITPPSRRSVSYSYLSNLLADYLIKTNNIPSEDVESSLSEALFVLPTTRYGLALNPCFGSIDGFRSPPGKPVSGELALFELAKVSLYHGWVADPQDQEMWDVMVDTCGDYDSAVERIVEGDVLTGDEKLDGTEEDIMRAVEKRSTWTPDEWEKVKTAQLVRRFLDGSQTQLTYHGLFLLSTHLAPSSLSALFRNNHLSVIFRRPTLPSEAMNARTGTSAHPPELFTLVTDSTFSSEQDVVWESLEDVDGSAASFYDGALRPSYLRGGDWVGRERINAQNEFESVKEPSALPTGADFALAQQLQREEDAYTAQLRNEEQRNEQRESERRQVQAQHALEQQRESEAMRSKRRGTQPKEAESRPPVNSNPKDKRKEKKGEKCILM